MKKIGNEEYYSLFCRWRASGLNKAAFALEEGISRTTFYYWCKKFEDSEAVPPDSSGFSLMTPVPVIQNEPVIRISYPSGVRVDFFEKVDPDTIKRLL